MEWERLAEPNSRFNFFELRKNIFDISIQMLEFHFDFFEFEKFGQILKILIFGILENLVKF